MKRDGYVEKHYIEFLIEMGSSWDYFQERNESGW